MSSFERLIREHDDIEALAGRLAALVVSYPPDPVTGSSLLNDLATLVRDHLLEEDRSIYTVLIESGAATRNAEIGDLETQFQELSRDWLGYLTEWSGGGLGHNWPGFSLATAEMMPRLRKRVRIENDLLYPMALMSGAITLRDREGG